MGVRAITIDTITCLSTALAACLALWALSDIASFGFADESAGVHPLPSLVWMAPVLAGGGYSSEAMSYAVELAREYTRNSSTIALRQFAEHANHEFVAGLPTEIAQVVRKLMTVGYSRDQGMQWDIAVCHATPDVWHSDGAFGWGFSNPCPPRDGRFAVGRTMYETDRLPEKWVPRINNMDEVWVPSAFAVEQFTRSGVDASKLVVVPEAVDTDLFNPTMHEPLDAAQFTPGRHGKGRKIHSNTEQLFRFLSVFKWEKRKGWDILLQAYFEEFSADDNVELIMKTSKFHDNTNFEDRIGKIAAGMTVRKPLARYSVLSSDLALRELPRLYRAVDAFVLPSRGEGWGRPHVEAMAMALPVIATNWSGSTAFLSNQCALPLRIDGLSEVDEGPKGHRWAEPSLSHLRSLMRWVVENPAEAKAIGKRAREEMLANFSPQVIVERHVLPHLRRIASRFTKKKRRRRKSTEL